MEQIGILLRVSSKIQESDGTSLDVQKNMGLKISKKLGFKPIIFNEGSQSSYKVEINERIKLVELLEEIQKKNNGIRKVWVFNTDRLGRYSQSWYSILKIFLDYSVELYVGESTKPYDFNNPNDKLSIGILSLVSQYDNELRRLRSVMGKRNSLKMGNTFVGGTVPFGYSIEGKNLVINEGESKVVKKMFEMYKRGESTMNIKSYLDTKTEYTPKRSKDGWNLGTIQKMLGNTLYKGYQIWDWKETIGGVPKVVESITVKTPKVVSNKLWDEVQLKLNENKVHKTYDETYDSLFKGLLFCKSCGVVLSSSVRKPYPLYSCRSVEYKWKNSSKWENKHKNCSLKKSLRVEETDIKVLNHILKIIKESKRVREEYKIKNLSPKFDEMENLKKEGYKRTKELNERKKYLKKLSDDLIQIEFEIITNQRTKKEGKVLSDKISNLISEIESEVIRKEKELSIFTNSSKWIDWLNQMYLEIDSVEDMNLDKKKSFIQEYISKINVEYIPKSKSHKFDFEFKYPIIEDEITNVRVKDGRKEYQIKEGKFNTTLDLPFQYSNKTKLTDDEKKRLNLLISEMRVEKSLSLNQICGELNSMGLRTPTNKLWDKPKLSSYIKNMKVDVGKV